MVPILVCREWNRTGRKSVCKHGDEIIASNVVEITTEETGQPHACEIYFEVPLLGQADKLKFAIF